MTKQKILVDSWGYDMTLNDYCLVVRETPKTVECVMIGMVVTNDNGMGGGQSLPNPFKVTSDPFRLRKKDWGGGHVQYRGTYPFAMGHGKRFGRFAEWDGKPDYYNTWD